jgi:hypothetical protein
MPDPTAIPRIAPQPVGISLVLTWHCPYCPPEAPTSIEVVHGLTAGRVTDSAALTAWASLDTDAEEDLVTVICHLWTHPEALDA